MDKNKKADVQPTAAVTSVEDEEKRLANILSQIDGVGEVDVYKRQTMLRDIVRQLSYKSYRVSVVDERSEIAALCEGRSTFDLGFSTDVLEGVDLSLIHI